VSDSVLEGLAIEVMRSGETGAGGSGAVLEGLAVEVMRRLDPGEGQITQFRASILATGFPGPARVTHLDGPNVSSTEPAAARVTHEYFSVASTEPSAARVTHLYVQVSAIAGPPIVAYRGCDLLLEVFADDRDTVLWQATTHPDIPFPYLMPLKGYAEQEIDVAKGSASLGTVTVLVIDKPTIPGDQQSGWMTAKLAENVIPNLAGRRARLRRATQTPLPGEEAIFEILIDGVAGTPRLDPSYAAIGFEIRDTREVERKLRAFDGSVQSTTSMLPHGVVEPYGLNPDDGSYLLEAVGPLSGTFIQHNSTYPNPATGSIDLTGNPAADREVPTSIHQALEGTIAETGPLFAGGFVGQVFIWYRTRFPNLAIWWRPTGSSDPWHVIDGTHLVLDGTLSHRRTNLATVTTDIPDAVRIEWITFGDDRVAPGGLAVAPYDPVNPEAALPAHGQAIELLVVSSGKASTMNPVHIEGMTAGQFAKNLYDGLYSARGVNGEIVPSGILYDADALLAMTEPVRLRITEPITDGRDWLEKYIYTPLGYCPALDIYGRISPISQVAPTDLTGIPVVEDAVSEPSPDWHAGERILNVIRFTYPRDYVPEDPNDADTGDGLSAREILIEYRDEVSITRHGEQVLEIDGRAFRALGTPKTAEPLLEAGASAEQGYILAGLRQVHVQNRYSLGAPAISLHVLRRATPDLRAGSWVVLALSWLPDYVTRRRGLVAVGQVMAIGDDDCVWRRLLIEQVVPLLPES